MLLKLAPTVNNEMHFMDSKAGNAKVPQSTTEYGYPKFLYNRKQKTTQTQLKHNSNTTQTQLKHNSKTLQIHAKERILNNANV